MREQDFNQLKQRNVDLPFTVFEESRREGPYYGALA